MSSTPAIRLATKIINVQDGSVFAVQRGFTPAHHDAAVHEAEKVNSGHFPTVGERLLILKAVIQRRLGDRCVPTLRG